MNTANVPRETTVAPTRGQVFEVAVPLDRKAVINLLCENELLRELLAAAERRIEILRGVAL